MEQSEEQLDLFSPLYRQTAQPHPPPPQNIVV